MPDIFGFPTEAELRGQQAAPMLTGYAPPTRAELEARDAAARAGNGTFSNAPGMVLTGDQFRNSTDPAVVAERNRMLQGGRSDPNLLFGGTDGRQQSDAERQYRHDYHNFMRNPNEGVDHNEALRSLGLFALAPIAGYAFGPGAGAGAAGSAAGEAAAGAAAGGVGGVTGAGAGTGIGATGAAAGTGAGFAGYGAMGGMQPNSGLGVFSNGGVGGMADVGAGNMGSLVNSMAGGGGVMSTLLENAGGLQSLLGGGGGEQGGGAVAPMPMPVPSGFMGSIPMPQRSTRQTTPLNQDVTRMRGYSRTPYSFNGATVWL